MSGSSIKKRLEELERAGGLKPDFAIIEMWDPDIDSTTYIYVDRVSGRSFTSDRDDLSEEEAKRRIE